MKFYIDGRWVKPALSNSYDVVNPATEEVAGQISLGSSADVDEAVAWLPERLRIAGNSASNVCEVCYMQRWLQVSVREI